VTDRFPDITGALIAGGRAARLGGRPKGLLQIDGEPLAVRALRLFTDHLGGALLVADDPAPYASLGVRTVPDLLPGHGAPGGLHAALAAAATPWVFAAACDMPFLSRPGLALLAARRAGALAVVPRWEGRYQPLHALWSREALARIARALQEGNPSLQELVTLVGARVVEAAEWRAFDPAGLAFENVNTPEEVAALGLDPAPGR